MMLVNSFKVVPGVVVTWDPANKSTRITLSGGNLIATANNSGGTARATLGRATGKYYFEILAGETDGTDTNGSDGGRFIVGVVNELATVSAGPSGTVPVGGFATGWAYTKAARKTNSATPTVYGNTWTNADVIGIAVDIDSGKVWFAKNGVWQASGDPVTGATPAFSGLTGTIYPAISPEQTGGPNNFGTGRFKASSFTMSVPSGYAAWEQ